MLFDLDPTRLIAAGVILLVGFPVHEFSHALAAYRLGDSTARFLGRLTLNPLAHLDPFGALALLLTGMVGWAKPTPVNPVNLSGGRRGEALVAAAGPLSNLVLAMLFAIPFRAIVALGLRNDVPIELLRILDFCVLINLALMLFNLVPIPPLDGYRVLLGLVDPRTAWRLRAYEPYAMYGLLILVFLLAATPLRFAFGRLLDAMTGFLIGV
ncbi:MAG: hypothetical protein A2X23_05720 [Chloroflexi bacterium GWC2_73_18]|nr:MAG: hypothetical protein A2X23_05720 [Chloroflexi bacterium GWC2_73_18]